MVPLSWQQNIFKFYRDHVYYKFRQISENLAIKTVFDVFLNERYLYIFVNQTEVMFTTLKLIFFYYPDSRFY